GGGAEPPNTLQPAGPFTVTITAPTELQSGLATWRLDFQQASLVGGVCAGWSGWNPHPTLLGAGAPPASVNDTQGTGCYRYRLRTTDNVGNVGTSAMSANTVMVDAVAPGISITSPPNLSFQS